MEEKYFLNMDRRDIIFLATVLIVLSTFFVYQHGFKDMRTDDTRKVEKVNFSGVTAEVVRRNVGHELIKVENAPYTNISIEKGSKVVWWNRKPGSSIVMVTKDNGSYFEATVPGFTNTSWSFQETGEYRYYVDNVNNTGLIRVKEK